MTPGDTPEDTLRIVMAQSNFLMGDMMANARNTVEQAHKAKDELGADLIVFPELNITGYPPEDLLYRARFHEKVNAALKYICKQVKGIDLIVGHPRVLDEKIFNSASFIHSGKISATYDKQHLPNYSVFDEKRYFTAGSHACIVAIKNLPIGIIICEDTWFPGPTAQAKKSGAKLIVSLNASPFDYTKSTEREDVLQQRVDESDLPIIYVNCVGGQDEIVFDGGSKAIDTRKKICRHGGFYEESLTSVDIKLEKPIRMIATKQKSPLSELESIYGALVLGVKDYVNKNGFHGALIGLSGGIDSALTLAITVDALGSDRVEAVMMPSRYTSEKSIEDAEKIAKNFGVKYSVISIEPAFQALLDSLKDEFKRYKPDTTEENLQARCRGIILMAISNKKGRIVLTTGNKSEVAVGYTTLYGDMAGGFNVLKDVSKTLVFKLAKYRNKMKLQIPKRVISRPPSAELSHGQKDEDSLPPYPILDKIIDLYVIQDKSPEEIVAAGFDKILVRSIIKMITRAEHKRRQGPPGIRISRKAFGRDRRYPITSDYM